MGVSDSLSRRAFVLRCSAVVLAVPLAALLTRFGVFDAGMASAKDPKYTVIPQKERLAARENGHAPSVTR